MHSNGTLPLPLTLMLPLDARCVYKGIITPSVKRQHQHLLSVWNAVLVTRNN